MTDLNIRCFGVTVITIRETDTGFQTLLLKRADTMVGEWCPVSGSIEDGETAWQTALRELSEETNLTPTTLYTADHCQQYYDIKRECISIMPAFVAVVPASDTITLNAEHSDYKWLPFDQAISMVPFPGLRETLQLVQRNFCDKTPSPILAVNINA